MKKLKKLNILILDHHSLFSESMCALLARQAFTGKVVMTSEKELAGQLKKISFDIIIVDIDVLNNLQIIRKITKRYPQIKVLALTAEASPRQLVTIIKSGALGYVVTDVTGKKEFFDAVKTVATGNTFFSQKATESINEWASAISIFDHPDEPETEKKTAISKREIEVLRLICEGLSNIEIAKLLFLSEHTIISHRRNLLHKLNARNTPELVKTALNKGWWQKG